MTDEMRDPREVRNFQEDIVWPARVPPVTDYYDFSISFTDIPVDSEKFRKAILEMVDVASRHGFHGELQDLGSSPHPGGGTTFSYRRMKS